MRTSHAFNGGVDRTILACNGGCELWGLDARMALPSLAEMALNDAVLSLPSGARMSDAERRAVANAAMLAVVTMRAEATRGN